MGVARRFVDTKYGVDREILLTLSIAEAYKKCYNSRIQLSTYGLDLALCFICWD